MFKRKVWVTLVELYKFMKTLTYQGLFGAQLEEGAHLLHNPPNLYEPIVPRCMEMASRQRFKARIPWLKAQDKLVIVCCSMATMAPSLARSTFSQLKSSAEVLLSVA
jgi:hypothetical protein